MERVSATSRRANQVAPALGELLVELIGSGGEIEYGVNGRLSLWPEVSPANTLVFTVLCGAVLVRFRLRLTQCMYFKHYVGGILQLVGAALLCCTVTTTVAQLAFSFQLSTFKLRTVLLPPSPPRATPTAPWTHRILAVPAARVQAQVQVRAARAPHQDGNNLSGTPYEGQRSDLPPLYILPCRSGINLVHQHAVDFIAFDIPNLYLAPQPH